MILTSGKSVLLHQVALIVFLAHIGSYVPCNSALIGITDKIITRISTQQSISKNESSFFVDLKEAANAIFQSTPRSLVLMDEFGKGTVPSDGIGLFCSIIKILVSKKTRMLASSHFHGMK
jgi:DNA mismatch repair protein MSH5